VFFDDCSRSAQSLFWLLTDEVFIVYLHVVEIIAFLESFGAYYGAWQDSYVALGLALIPAYRMSS
jgi:hypothetical protein